MNLYEILGISPGASADEIKEAYLRLRSKHHPDKGGDKAMFDQVQKAYETLGNSSQRNIYDYVHGFTGQAKPRTAPKEPKGQASSSQQANTNTNAKEASKGPARPKFRARNFDATGLCKSCAGSGRLRVAMGYKTAIVSCVKCFGYGTNKSQ